MLIRSLRKDARKAGKFCSSLWKLLLVLCLIAGVPAAAEQIDESQILRALDELTGVAARVRGLELKGPIQKGIKSREEITGYMARKINEDYQMDRILLEEKMLKKTGLLPEKIDYQQTVIDLLTEQVQGFYDPEERMLFIASWLPMSDQESVMTHEIAHALQDQHFDLQARFRANRNSDNDDYLLAQQALFEGDATVTALQFTVEPLNRHFSDLPNLAFIMETQMDAEMSKSPALSTTPRFLRETLIFPYGYGAAFLQEAWKRNPSWEAVNKIYSDPPVSSEQIMHPEKYYGTRDNPKPVNAAEKAAKLGAEWKIPYKSVFGEFMLGQMLELHMSKDRARRAAAGWGGDEVLLLENGTGRNAVWIETEWDTGDDAEKFFAAMDDWFRLRYSKVSRRVTPEGFLLIQNGEFSALFREGASVRIILGLPEADGKKLYE
ncbi:MAG: hypothetical protein LBJ21_03870 [Acidobacteriota bacterium]|nr:hypothetical protein [Acidobacteriota bacterium]